MNEEETRDPQKEIKFSEETRPSYTWAYSKGKHVKDLVFALVSDGNLSLVLISSPDPDLFFGVLLDPESGDEIDTNPPYAATNMNLHLVEEKSLSQVVLRKISQFRERY